MSQPYVQVLVDFDIIDLGSNPFQLDDASYGILDTSELASDNLSDLTSLVKSVSVSRGKSRQLDQFNAGTATVVFDNSSRILDPLNEDSVYYPNILPRCGIQITANGIPIFYGLIVDWNLSYDITGQDVMVAICTDDFTVLANQVLDAFTPTAELSGARISSVLARPEIEYLGTRQISAGSKDMGAYAVNAGTNTLNYLQLVAKSEQGSLFCSANGALTFQSATHTPASDVAYKFADDGTGIPYKTLFNQFGDELLYNYIITESPAGGPFVASDLTSQVRYQYQQLALTDLLNSSSGVVETIGTELLSKYKDPKLRWTGLSVQLSGLSLADQQTCLEMDLTYVCDVTKSFDVGAPASVTQTVSVSGIDHSIVPSSHIVTFTFEPSVSVTGAASDVVADGYRTVTWTQSGSIFVTGRLLDVEYLVVAGGGGGGRHYAGGGGAGGLLTNVGGTLLSISGDVAVTVGAGGAGRTGTNGPGSAGSDSGFSSILAVGGGFGGGRDGGPAGGAGGSGGGSAPPSTTNAAGTAGQGSNGGAGSEAALRGGGGGGAGAAGGNGSVGVSGAGGNGLSNSITGVSVTYAGGGGGAGDNGTTGGTGGTGGGGNGGSPSTSGVGQAGTDGLGGGGGGGDNASNGGDGGDGIVILRWAV